MLELGHQSGQYSENIYYDFCQMEGWALATPSLFVDWLMSIAFYCEEAQDSRKVNELVSRESSLGLSSVTLGLRFLSS